MPEDDVEQQAWDSLEDEISAETAFNTPVSAVSRLDMIAALRSRGGYRKGAGFAVAGLIVFGGVMLARSGGDKSPSEGGTAVVQPEPLGANDNPAAGPEPAVSAESMALSGIDINVEDPIGDWEEWGGFEGIIGERTADGVNAGEAMAAADLVGFDASSSGGSTELNLRFAGDAQGVQAFTRGDLSGGAEIVFPDGTRREIIFRDDGTVKMVSAPSGVKITGEWVGPDHLRLVIEGMALDPGSTIEARVVLSIFDGTAQDIAGP